MVEQLKTFYGGVVSYDTTEVFEPLSQYTVQDNTAIVNKYYEGYRQNPWIRLFVSHLVKRLFTDFHLDGTGKEEVEAYLREFPQLYDEIELMGLYTILAGTGLMFHGPVNGGVQFKAIDPTSVTISWSGESDTRTAVEIGFTSADGKPVSDVIYLYGKKYSKQGGKAMAMLKLLDDPEQPYGISFLSDTYDFFNQLYTLMRSIPVGLVQNFSAIKIISADLSGFATQEDKENYLKEVAKNFKEMNTAVNAVIAIDKNNEITLLGGKKGGDVMTDVLAHVSPIMTPIIFEFLMALGLIYQEGANKSLIAKQMVYASDILRRFRTKIARFLENAIFSHVTSKNIKVIYTKLLSIDDMLSLYSSGIVTREWIHQQLGIKDTGKTYVYDTPIAMRPELKGRRDISENNDDNPDRKATHRPDLAVSKEGE